MRKELWRLLISRSALLPALVLLVLCYISLPSQRSVSSAAASLEQLQPFGIEIELACASSSPRCGDTLYESIRSHYPSATVHANSSHGFKVTSAWRVEVEHPQASPRIWEVVSPILDGSTENVASLASMSSMWWASQQFIRNDWTSLHVTISASCLLGESSALGLLNFLAITEAAYPLMRPLFSDNPVKPRLGHLVYSPSMRGSYPRLLDKLMRGGVNTDAVARAFDEFPYEDRIPHPRVVTDSAVLAGFSSLQGARYMATNVCKILPIRCCEEDSGAGRRGPQSCRAFNQESKPGIVEFRWFDVVVGAQLQAAVVLAQHMVLKACSAHAEGQDVRPVLWDLSPTRKHVEPRGDMSLGAWLLFLGVPTQHHAQLHKLASMSAVTRAMATSKR